MKKQLLILSILLLGSVSYLKAQIYTPAGMIQGASGSNNVGIGTNNPVSKLDIAGDAHIKVVDDKSGIGGLTIDTNGGTTLKMGGNFTYSWIQSHMSLPLYINELGNNTVFNLVGGNVGIGTAYPKQKFVVSNNSAEGFEVYLDPALAIVGLQSFNRSTGTHSKMQLDASQFTFMYGNLGIGTTNPKQKFVVSNNSAEGFEVYLDPALAIVGLQSFNRSKGTHSKMQLDASQFAFMYGNLGIGTTNPQNKLDVNGTIHSKEVKVDMNGWSDFVFKKDYSLPTLEEVEKHIAEKGHLENIPSEKEVLQNGINLGEINAKLLQKIEEMTLYMIEQSKEIKNLKKENEVLRSFSERLSKVENQLNNNK